MRATLRHDITTTIQMCADVIAIIATAVGVSTNLMSDDTSARNTDLCYSHNYWYHSKLIEDPSLVREYQHNTGGCDVIGSTACVQFKHDCTV